jgi:hypothetical protein
MAQMTHQIDLVVGQISQDIAALAKIGISKIALDLVAAIKENTPVDKGILKQEWEIIDDDGDAGVLVRKIITNRMPYAEPVEFGSPKGQLPWKTAGPKTVEREGRIYSSQAVGGILQPIIDSGYLDAAGKELADFISDGL